METSVDPIVLIGLLAAGMILVFLGLRRSGPSEAETQALEKIAGSQAELAGRLNQLAEAQAHQQAQVTRMLDERLDGVSRRLGDGLREHTEKTGQSMSELAARLAVIDQAQKNLTDLSQQMVGLQDILANKQARGAFGEIQLNDLVASILPPSAYTFQATLSNGRRADCLLQLPDPPGPIVIDAKFPLDGFQRLRDAEDDAAKVQAARAFQQDVVKHVKDIAEKYIVQGETAESALMFLPSEAVYAELHANFRNVVEESFRRRVWIVSPTTLMATLNTVRAVLKDARMREQAGVIQTEVFKLIEDVERLDKRVGNLRTHFGQAEKDIKDIEVSAGKISSRSEKIQDLQLGEDEGETQITPPEPAPKAAPQAAPQTVPEQQTKLDLIG